MTIDVPYVSILASTTSSITLTYWYSISFRYMSTGSVTFTTPRKSVSVRTRFIQHGRYRHDPHYGRPSWPLKTLQLHLLGPRPPLVPSVTKLLIFQSTHPLGKRYPPWPCRGGCQRLCRFPQRSVPRGPQLNCTLFFSSLLWVYEDKFTQLEYSALCSSVMSSVSVPL